MRGDVAVQGADPLASDFPEARALSLASVLGLLPLPALVIGPLIR